MAARTLLALVSCPALRGSLRPGVWPVAAFAPQGNSLAPLLPPATRSTRLAALAANHRCCTMAADVPPPPRAQVILEFWFGEGWATAEPDDTRPEKAKVWFRGGPELDAEIVSLFSPDCEALLAGQYDGWPAQPLGALAGIILGDQLFRNAFRGTAKMYAADERVLAWAKQLMTRGADRQLAPIQRVWVYMTLMHSEELADQDECISRFQGLSSECEAAGWPAVAKMTQENVKYAQAHREVVARWGRFPHRNAILGRQNTAEEAEGIAAGTIPKW